jgi:hypothetical protein
MTRFLTAAAAAILIVATIACQRPATAPSPAAGGNTAIVGLAIRGPERLIPGETARFTAMATMSDGSTQDYTQKVSWLSFPQDVLTIARTTGEGTARNSGDAFVWTDAATSCCASARAAVLVLPRDTYRLTGKVQESGLPIQGATVTVVSGTGTGLSAATDYNGQYRLYGVAGALQVQVSKAGYTDLVKAFTSAQNDVLDFPEARQTQTLPSLSGSYVLTLEADSGCPTASTDPRTPHLPADMQRARSYAVQVTQDGPALHVAGVGPAFLAPSDGFRGRLIPDGVEFELGDGYFGYGPDNAFSAYISPTQALSYEGRVYASRVGSTVVGRLDGAIELYEKSPAFYRPIGQCRGGNHRFSMTAATDGTAR